MDWRLTSQLPILLNDLKEVQSNIEADICIIAGDITESPLVPPKVQHVIKSFLHELGSMFSKIYYILGQHDFDSKSQTQNYEDSFINTIMPSNAEYMDMKELMIDNTRVAFMNWKPEQDLNWYKGSVDLLIGHITANWFGQEIDESKFEVAIAGDIHQSGWYSKICKIGTPMQNKLGDQSKKTVMYFDFMTKEFDWITLEDDIKTPRYFTLIKTQDRLEEGWHGNLYKTYRPILDKVEEGDDNFDHAIKISELDETITEILSEAGLLDLHNAVKSISATPEEIDFNFKSISLEITNYKSIKHAKVDFDFRSRYLVTGANGAGKSSFLHALHDVIFGNRFLRSKIHRDEDSCELVWEFNYQDSIYKLKRGSHSWGLESEGNWLPFNNKRSFESDIMDRFPFIRFPELIYYSQDDPYPLTRLGSDRKVELITKMFKLDIIEAYSDGCNQLSDHNRVKLDALRSRKSTLDLLVKEYQSEVDKYKDVIGDVNHVVLKLRNLTSLRSDALKYIYYVNKVEVLEKSISELKESISKDSSKLESEFESDLESRISKVKTSIESHRKDLEKVSEGWIKKAEISKLKSEIEELNSKEITIVDSSELLDSLDTEIKNLEDALGEKESFQSSLLKELDVQDRLKITLEDLKSRYNKLTDDLEECVTGKCHSCNQKLPNNLHNEDDIKAEMMKVQSKISELTTKLDDDLTKRISENDSEISKLTLSIQVNKTRISEISKTLKNLPDLGQLTESIDQKSSKVEDLESAVKDVPLETIKKYALDSIKRLDDECYELLGKISKRDALIKSIEHSKYNLELRNKEISELEVPDKVELGDANEQISELTELKVKMQTRDSWIHKLNSTMAELVKVGVDIDQIKSELEIHEKYLSFMGRTGRINELLLNQLANKFTTSEFKYEVISTTWRGRDVLDLQVKYNVEGHLTDYDDLSGGEKCITSLHFASNVFRSGILVMDEPFGAMDSGHLNHAMEILKDLTCNNAIIATHSESFTDFDRSIHVTKHDKSGTELNVI